MGRWEYTLVGYELVLVSKTLLMLLLIQKSKLDLRL